MKSAKYHFMEEELQIFPKAKKTLKGDWERMGKEMQALEKQLMEECSSPAWVMKQKALS